IAAGNSFGTGSRCRGRCPEDTRNRGGNMTTSVDTQAGRPWRARLRASFWVAVGAYAGLAGSGAAFGQASGAETLEEVVVTGSRIARRDLTSASPLVTVSTESLTNTAQVGLETVLNKLPQFSPGGNQFSAATDVQASPTNTPGAATLNLRGL